MIPPLIDKLDRPDGWQPCTHDDPSWCTVECVPPEERAEWLRKREAEAMQVARFDCGRHEQRFENANCPFCKVEELTAELATADQGKANMLVYAMQLEHHLQRSAVAFQLIKDSKEMHEARRLAAAALAALPKK